MRDAMVTMDARSTELLKSYLVGDNLKRWHVESQDLWVIYTPKNRVDIDDYPAVRDHLLPFKEKLKNRATRQNWWELQQAQAAYEHHFGSPTVVWRDISKGPTFSFLSDPTFLDCTTFFWPRAPMGLVCYLGSKCFWFQLAGLTPIARGNYARLKSQYFSAIPHPNTQFDESISEALNELCSERHAISAGFVRRCHDISMNGVRRGDGVLQDWPKKDFDDFRKAIKTTFRAEIPVAERDQWEAYFNSRKAELQTLDARIAGLEAEINDRAYRAFDLTAGEIALIEEALAGQY